MNLLNSPQRNYRFHAVSRRSKFTAAAAYENHAAWRRSAAADNTVIQNMIIASLGLKWFLILLQCIPQYRSILSTTHFLPNACMSTRFMWTRQDLYSVYILQ